MAGRRDHRGTAGMSAGVVAGLVWGLAFLVPVLLGGWNPVIVTLGRYLAYGLFPRFCSSSAAFGSAIQHGNTGAPR